ncbi:MAG: phage holin family protein [Vulcanimicrobiaceae bacterium]
MKLVIRFIITAVALYFIATYVPGFHLNGWGDAAIAAIIFGIVNAIIGPILKLISLPLTILTIGLFTVVINWILFALTVWLSPGFKTTGTPWPAWEATLVGAVIMMVVSTVATSAASEA